VFVPSGFQQRVEFATKNIRENKMNTHVVVVVVDVVVGLGTVCVCWFLEDVSNKLKLLVRKGRILTSWLLSLMWCRSTLSDWEQSVCVRF
jgi:hypothetical protein